ncbi:hypothetical protein RA955_14455 [Geobacillus proteiniphilus]|uniref:Uncharacterized protein n=1 Tax=Geobacillus proteiniphilus TaxID=860353 RepID=A0A1Q5T4V9_9BACL|nr:hypothetical protein [Geobacillus proteiniphilus]OKO95259.1 hypothetical protein BRO54_1064 [Geobacillus proteiniphilus]WMJ15901.1 hypothetical protein RA955_14455 [Geobacillus proteiniphilus]
MKTKIFSIGCEHHQFRKTNLKFIGSETIDPRMLTRNDEKMFNYIEMK